jgi:hypothetical protein
MAMIKIAFILILLAIGTLLSKAQLALNNSPYQALLASQPNTNIYLFQEFFEAPGYQNVWTTNGVASINPANSTSPLQGVYSLSISLSADGGGVYSSFGAQSTVYGFFKIRFSSLPLSGDEDFIALNAGGGKALLLFLSGGNVVRISDGSAFDDTVDAILINTTYNCWWSYQAGSGADAVYTFAFSTGTTRPTGGNNFVQVSNGVRTGTVDSIRCGADASPGVDSWAARYDSILFSTSQIGDNPP